MSATDEISGPGLSATAWRVPLVRPTARGCALAALGALSLACHLARGQTRGVVTEADVDRARHAQPVITEGDIARAARANQPPPGFDKGILAPGPRLDRLPRPLVSPQVDLGALARGYDESVRQLAAGQGLDGGARLLVFISLDMPQAALRKLATQAGRARATLVLRGLAQGSLVRTVAQARQVTQGRAVALQIDPQAFDRFSVSAVPTFVLLRPGAVPQACAAGQCFATDGYVRLAGDVSIDYALEHIERDAPAFRAQARELLDRIRE